MTDGSATDRYRVAERALWNRYALEPTERFVELSEPRTRLRIVEVGSGPPVLFVPGSGGTGPYWAPLVRELTGFRCLMLDRPGWGLSAPVDYAAAPYWSQVTATLAGVLDRLGLERVDVVGASIGGAWALRLAQSDPARVRRVVLLGGSPTQEIEVPRFIRLLRSPLGALIVRLPMRGRMLQQQLVGLGHGPSVEAGRFDDFLPWRLAFHRETDSMRNERDMVRAIIGPEGFRAGVTFDDHELWGIHTPVLMLFGSADPTGSPDTWRGFTKNLPEGRLETIEGAGHLLWWDDPGTAGGHVRDFLS